MASDEIARMEDALIRAHQAGDAEAAQVIAEEIKARRAPAAPQNVIQQFNTQVSGVMPDAVNEAVDVAGQPASGIIEGVGRMVLAPIDLAKAGIGVPERITRQATSLVKKLLPGLNAEKVDLAVKSVVMSNPAFLSMAVGNRIRKKLGLPEPAGSEDLKKAMMESGVTAPEATDSFGRITRRIGEEVGAASVPAAAALRAAGRPTNLLRQSQGVVGQTVESARTDPTKFVRQEGTLAASGGAGAGIAKELFPDSPAAELIGVMVGSVVPTAAAGTFRHLVRGGEGHRQTLEQSIKEFGEVGAVPTVGIGTRRRFNQAVESGLAILPGSSGRMAAYSEKTARQLYQHVDNVTAGLTPIRSPDLAGAAIKRGITGPGGFIQNFKATWRRLDSRVKVAPTARVAMPETRAAMVEMTDPATSAAFPQLNALATKLDDLTRSGAMTYKDLRVFRSSVGGLIPESYTANLPQGLLKKLYGAMSHDLRNHLAATDPGALRAFDRSSRYYTAAMKRLDESLAPVLASDIPERMFLALERSGHAGRTVINAAKRSIGKDNWDAVTGTIFHRMGLAKAGAQSMEGDVFSVETFLTNWNRYKQSGGALDALLSGTSGGSRFVKDMTSVARVAERFREAGRVFANPSGTARAIANVGLGTSVATSVIQGHLKTAATILAVAVSANLSAGLFTNPNFVRFMAQSARTPAARMPGLIARLGRQMASEPEHLQVELAGFLDRLSDEFSMQAEQDRGAKTRR